MPTLPKDSVVRSKHAQILLGERLALARLRQGITQLDALKLTGLLIEHPDGRTEGVTKGFLAYVESARRSISLKQLESLAKLYQTPVKWFLDSSPLSDNEEKVLMRLLSSAKRRTVKSRGFHTMSTETPNRQVVAVVTHNGPAEAPRKRGRPRKDAAAYPVSIKPVSTVLTAGDQSVIEAIKSCSESEKYWVAKAIETLLTKVKSKAPVA